MVVIWILFLRMVDMAVLNNTLPAYVITDGRVSKRVSSFLFAFAFSAFAFAYAVT